MAVPAADFHRRANPIAAVFRYGFLYSFLTFPAWFILRGWAREQLPGLLGVFFSVLILLLVVLIRLRTMLNRLTDRRAAEVGSGESGPVTVRQSFDFRQYLGLNLEVMFSYLRPYLTVAAGFLFFGLTVAASAYGYDPIRMALSGILTLYYLTVPWVLFIVKTRRVYRSSAGYQMDQQIRFDPGRIGVRAGSSEPRDIRTLTDLAVTRHYILFFLAGSGYIPVRRENLGPEDERRILTATLPLIVAEPAGRA